MSDSFAYINVNDIDLSDKRFLHFTPFIDTKDLADSIKHTGLIHPVWVRPENEHYIAVSGVSRINAYKYNQEQTIPAFVLSREADDYTCLLKAITAVSSCRELSQAELIRCLVHLSRFRSVEEIERSIPGLFHTPLSGKFIRALIDIGQIQPALIDLIEAGLMSVKTAEKLRRFDPEQRRIILDLFMNIKVSASVQSEIVTHLFEISQRDRIDFKSVLADSGITDMLNNSQIDGVAKARKIRKILYEKRFPKIAAARKRVQQTIQALKPGSELKIEPSDTFEDPYIRFSFRAKNRRQYQHCLEKLDSLAGRADFERLLEQ